MTLSKFVKEKVDFKYDQKLLWVSLSKKKLTLNNDERKVNFWTFPNMTLSMFFKGKVDLRCVEIWLWVFLLKEKLTLDVSKYDLEYFC
jgi:hypothetical protein